MIDTDDLDLLIAVVDAGSTTAAGERIHLSQPAVSRRIHAIERVLRVRLFQKVGRRLELTEAGEELIWRAREIHQRMADLEVEMGAFGRGQRGVLRIGATVTVCLYLLPPVLVEMRRRYPQYELFVTNDTSRRMPSLVRDGLVDVGIASINAPLTGLHVRMWMELRLGLLSQRPLAKNPVSVRELQGVPLVTNSPGSIRSQVDQILRDNGVEPRIVAEADSLEVVQMLVGCGFGSAIVPMEVMQVGARESGLCLSPLAEETPCLPVGCFYRRSLPPLKAFLDLLPASMSG